jgi:hypothetical protein
MLPNTLYEDLIGSRSRTCDGSPLSHKASLRITIGEQHLKSAHPGTYAGSLIITSGERSDISLSFTVPVTIPEPTTLLLALLALVAAPLRVRCG